MAGDIPVGFVFSLIALLVVASFSSVIFKKIGFPLTIGLVLVGVGLGYSVSYIEPLGMLQNFSITPNVLLYVLLPALLFDASINMEVRLLKRNLVPVLVLAAPGLILATFITALIVSWLTPLGMLPALVFGALISSTDPVAVISLFKELGVSRRLVMLVDGESLFNDATAIVAFQVVTGIVAGGVLGAMSIFKAGMSFTLVFAGGFAVGALTGWVIVQLLSIAKGDPFIEMTFTTIAAYLSFVMAQYYMGLSGVMSVVGTGMVIAHYSISRYSAAGRQYMKMFWSFASFVTNSFIFLMLGISEFHLIQDSGRHWQSLVNILTAIVAVLIARAITVYGLVPLLNRLPRMHKIDVANQTVIFWGGLRGALPVGLAISLTPDLFGPGSEAVRRTIIEMTFGVVIFTLLVQGTTIKKLISMLGLDKPSSLERTARAYGTSVAKKSAYKALEKLAEEWCLITKGALDPALANIDAEVNNAKKDLAESLKDPHKQSEIKNVVLWTQVFTLSRQFASELYDCGFISEKTMRNFQTNCEHASDDIQQYIYPPPDFDKMPYPAFKADGAGLKLTKKIHYFFRLNRKIALHRLTLVFEWYSLVSETAVMVDSELGRISHICGAGREDVAKCRNYFQSLFESARDILLDMKSLHPEAIEALVKKTTRKVSLVAEYRSIEQLQKTGGLSEDAAEYLLNDITPRLDSPEKA